MTSFNPQALLVTYIVSYPTGMPPPGNDVLAAQIGAAAVFLELNMVMT
jgi:hypothetical protein